MGELEKNLKAAPSPGLLGKDLSQPSGWSHPLSLTAPPPPYTPLSSPGDATQLSPQSFLSGLPHRPPPTPELWDLSPGNLCSPRLWACPLL